ncbi:carboxypeptidase-like regulatory domain-containing protein [Marinoscillum sp.]|uniref:carboxypeptidase-like regulatory domain-containing protein n=1 Tax=Marinoscillum sp. TaxID=2024838 RepID=UPI003BAA8BE0
MRIIALLIFVIPSITWSQRRLEVKLVDNSTGDPVENANIVIYGTSDGTVSDSMGLFNLTSKKKKLDLAISHLSYGRLDTTLQLDLGLQKVSLFPSSWFLDPINLRLGEYSGPETLIPFDSLEYNGQLNRRLNSYTNGEFLIVEDMAEFYGGKENLGAFMASNFKYPSRVLIEKLEGTAYVLFEVDKEGRTAIESIKIIGSGDIDEVRVEFDKLFEEMPIWLPAYQRGKPVKVRFVVPVQFAGNGYGVKN